MNGKMSEFLKQKASVIVDVVLAVILAVAVGLTAWTASMVVNLNREMGVNRNDTERLRERMDRFEVGGTPSLMAHVQDDNTRIKTINDRLEKQDAANVKVAEAITKLEALSVRLDALREGQSRIERALEQQKIK